MTDDQLNEISMQMLNDAGKAKHILTDILDDMNSHTLESSGVNDQLTLAHQWLVKAHKQQNLVIAESEQTHYSVLFTHAQDTLMNTETIEFIIKKFIPILLNDN